MELVTKEEYERLKTSLKQRAPHVSCVVGGRFEDYLKVGIYHFQWGARNFGSWSSRMEEDFGRAVVPFLQETWLSMPTAAQKIASEILGGILRQTEIVEIETLVSTFNQIKLDAMGKYTLSAQWNEEEALGIQVPLRNGSNSSRLQSPQRGEYLAPERKLSPGSLRDLVVLGVYYFERGALNFEEWSEKLLAELKGYEAAIQPHLLEVWALMLSELKDRAAKNPALREQIEAMLATPRQTIQRELKQHPARNKPGAAEMRGLAKVAGMHDLKVLLLMEVVQAFRHPAVFQQYGLTLPQGILLYGPPGCGKTYIARQLAEELGCSFIEASQSDVSSSYVHGTALRIRDLFEAAEKAAPCVLFIDEFEGIVPSRANLGGHQQYKSEEVNEFLVRLSGCAEKGILVVGATNEPEKIDAAVLRTGRMDKLIYVGPPDADARIEMLRLHLSNRPTEPSMDIRGLAAILDGYSASDIRFLVDEAARKALAKKSKISTGTLLEALDRVPPSITKDMQSRYRAFASRGI